MALLSQYTRAVSPAATLPDSVQILPPDGKTRRLLVSGYFSLGVERLWQVVTDYDRYAEFMPRVISHRVIERQTQRRVVEATLDFKLARVSYCLELTHDCEALQIHWRMLRGDLRVNRGSWRFQPQADGGTLAEYQLEIDPGLPVPSWVADRLIARDLRGLFPALRKRCASD